MLSNVYFNIIYNHINSKKPGASSILKGYIICRRSNQYIYSHTDHIHNKATTHVMHAQDIGTVWEKN